MLLVVPALRQRWPCYISRPCHLQIRNTASLGGNICTGELACVVCRDTRLWRIISHLLASEGTSLYRHHIPVYLTYVVDHLHREPHQRPQPAVDGVPLHLCRCQPGGLTHYRARQSQPGAHGIFLTLLKKELVAHTTFVSPPTLHFPAWHHHHSQCSRCLEWAGT